MRTVDRARALGRQAKTVRGRSTLLASGVVAVAMVVGSLLLLGAYRGQLVTSLDQSLQQQVNDRVGLLDRGSAPQSLVTVLQDEEALVWIGRPDGEPVAVSEAVQPLENPVPVEIGTVGEATLLVVEAGHDGGGDEQERMTLRLASSETGDGALVVIAAAESEAVDKAVADLARLFLIGLPPLLALVAGLTWMTTGRALRPVEGIRARAADIHGTNLGGRVDVPATGDEIERLARTVNQMLDRIEAHDHSLRQFTADASHELKSPVANLRALVETASIDDPKWPEVKARLAGESDRLRNLVDNLLFLAASEAGRPIGGAAVLALDELLFAEAELVAATGDVVVDLGGVVPAEVTGSASDLGRLVRNLVDNAVRHAGSTISLAIENDGPHTIVVIGDDGPGVADQDRDRIFERFTRLDAARARGEGGTGLGLAIARLIAEGHGGTVTVGRSPLGGAEFRASITALTGPTELERGPAGSMPVDKLEA